ncbi:MAG: hypothetical protein R3324_08520, partial [Halobacteriales archaeon]|nr:hypothetical protein [Halobacteriales archaeon]
MSDKIRTDVRFAMVPEWVLDRDISSRAVHLYAIIAAYSDLTTSESDATGAFPSRRTLARRLRCGTTSLGHALRELLDVGAIEKHERHRDNGSQTTNLYTIHRIDPLSVERHPPSRRSDTPPVGGATPHTENQATENQATEKNPKNVTSGLASRPDEFDPEEEFTEDVVRLTRMLAQGVIDNGYPVPSKGSKAARRWFVEMDRLLRLGPPGDGGRVPESAEEVAAVIRWAVNDHDDRGGKSWTGWANVIR